MNPTQRLKYAALPFAALCLAPFACLAQGSPTPEQTYEIVTETIKPGMTAKFVQGVKAVDDYARSHGDPVGTEAYEITDGPRNGQIVILVPFNWATADQPASYEAGLDSVATKNVEPYTSSIEFQLTDVLPQYGNLAPANSPPMKYYEVEQYVIKPDKIGEFLAALTQITAAEHKENPGSNPVSVFEMRSGGNPYEITVAIGHSSIADFAKPGKSVFEALRGAYGDDAAIAIYRSAEESIASEQNYIAQYRPDLSYVPNGPGQ